MEYHVHWKLKCSCFEYFGGERYGIFEPKSWWKYDICWLLKSSSFDLFGNGKYGIFLSQKVDGKIIFTDYWKVLVLIFSGMGNTVSFWAKKLMERWYLLITEKFLFWTFWWWEIRSFFQSRSWWKDDIYLVFLSFPWYSRKYGFWRSESCRPKVCKFIIKETLTQVFSCEFCKICKNTFSTEHLQTSGECFRFPVDMSRWFVHCSSGVVPKELSESALVKTYINDFLFGRAENEYLCYCVNFDVSRWFFILALLKGIVQFKNQH